MDMLIAYVAASLFGFLLLLLLIWNIIEIKRYTRSTWIIMWAIFPLLATIVVLLIAAVLIIIFAVYRQLVCLILKIKHGSKFRGLVSGSDCFLIIDDITNNICHALLMIQCDKSMPPNEFYHTLKNFMCRVDLPEKFRSTFHKSMGYAYMLEGERTMSDCVKHLKTVDSRCEKLDFYELQALMNDYRNVVTSEQETVSWEIGTQPVNWRDDKHNYYPLFYRSHHAVCDAATTMKFMVGFFGEKSSGAKISAKIPPTPEKLNKFQLLLRMIWVLCLTPACFTVNVLLRGKDDSILHGPTLTGKRITVFNIEAGEEYVQKIRKIKSVIPGTGFTNVLLTAFSASCNDYFIKNSSCIPNHITAVIPQLIGADRLRYLTPDNCNVESIKISNKYSNVLMTIPIAIKETEHLDVKSSLVHRLKLINEEVNAIKRSVDYYVNYGVMSIACSVFPQPIVRLVANSMRCTTTFSAISAPPKVVVSSKIRLADLIYWVPHLYNIGTTLGVVSYDGHLNVGLSSDKALIPNQQSAQEIVDGIYKYINLLENITSKLAERQKSIN